MTLMKLFPALVCSSSLLSYFYGNGVVVETIRTAARSYKQRSKQKRNLQSLQDRWYFQRNTTFEVQDKSLLFSYRTSDYIEDDMTHGVILDAETCNTLVPHVEDYGFVLNPPVSTDQPGDGFGSRVWIMELDINLPPKGTVPANAGLDGLPTIYKEKVINTTHTTGVWNFCILIALTTPPSDDPDDPYSELIVNWQEFFVEVEEDSDLQKLNVSLFDRTSLHTEAPEYADMFFCDASHEEISHPLLLEGDEVKLCITPPDGWKMTTIDFFKYEANDGNINQAAIRDGVAAQNGLTAFACYDDICAIRSVLFASFFAANTEVVAYGYANFTSPEGIEVSSGVAMNFETLFDLIEDVSIEESETSTTLSPTRAPISQPTPAPIIVVTPTITEAPAGPTSLLDQIDNFHDDLLPPEIPPSTNAPSEPSSGSTISGFSTCSSIWTTLLSSLIVVFAAI